MFNLRPIVKSVKDVVIWNAATAALITASNHVVDEPSENQEAGIDLGATAVGFVVMYKLKSSTDHLIDTVADWRLSRKVAPTPVVEQS